MQQTFSVNHMYCETLVLIYYHVNILTIIFFIENGFMNSFILK